MKPSKTAFPVDAIARNLNSPSLSEPTDCRSSPVAVRLINVRALPGCAFSLSSEREAGVLRASGKAVWTWPPVGAVDAGPMQIQLRKGVSVRCAEAVLWSATHDTAGAEDWLGRKSSAKTVVEEGARRDLAGSETGR